jgi:hypothetical protein
MLASGGTSLGTQLATGVLANAIGGGVSRLVETGDPQMTPPNVAMDAAWGFIGGGISYLSGAPPRDYVSLPEPPTATATRGGLPEARAARDALSASLAPLKGKAPATVTGGYNKATGEVTARACGGGKCAETHVVDALGGKKANVGLTEAVRPRTGLEVPVCAACEATYGRGAFPPGTKFKSQ